MPRLAFRWSVTINAPVEQVFGYMRDPNNLFHGLAGGNPDVKISDVKVTPEGVGTTARAEIHLPGLKHLGPTAKVSSEITEVVPNRRIAVKSSLPTGRMFKFDGTWTWTFEPDNGGTKLIVAYAEWANWLVYAFDRLTEKLQNREMNAYFADLKTTLEASPRLSGSGASRPSQGEGPRSGEA